MRERGGGGDGEEREGEGGGGREGSRECHMHEQHSITHAPVRQPRKSV